MDDFLLCACLLHHKSRCTFNNYFDVFCGSFLPLCLVLAGFCKVIPNTPVLVLYLLAMPSMPSTHVFWLVLVVIENFDLRP